MTRSLMSVTPMTTIDDACEDAWRQVNSINYTCDDELVFYFNSIQITAKVGCTVQSLIDQWDRARYEESIAAQEVIANPDCTRGCRGTGIADGRLCKCLRTVKGPFWKQEPT